MRCILHQLFLVVLLLTFVNGCAPMQNRWEVAKSADTIQAYEQFIKQYPKGDLTNQAHARLEQLYEQMDWKDVSLRNTVDSYENFIERYPQGTFLSQALSRLEALYFQKAKEANSIAAYEEFLQRYSTGKMADEARSRLKENILLGIKRLRIKIINYKYNIGWHRVVALDSGGPPSTEIIKNSLLEAVKEAFETTGYEVVKSHPITVFINYYDYYETGPSTTDAFGTAHSTSQRKNKLELTLIHDKEGTLCTSQFILEKGVGLRISSDGKVSYSLTGWSKEITEKICDSLPLVNWCR